MPSNQKRVAVIGAGIAGLSAAYELKKAGLEVKVLEKNNYPGGRMHTRFKENLAFDMGADFLSDNYSQLKKYAHELGIKWKETRPNGVHRVIKDGKPFSLNIAGAFDVFRFTVLYPLARLRFLFWIASLKFKPELNFFDLSEVPAKFDFDDAGHFLRTKVSPEIADYIADPFTASMQFHLSNEISTAALFALLQMMISKKNGFNLRYTEGGINAIPEALAKLVPPEFNSNISSIENLKKEFDAIVLATPAPVTLKILETPTEAQKKLLQSAKYSSTIVVSFKAPSEIFTDNTHCTYVPFVENKIIGGYTNEGRKGDEILHNGNTLINVYLHESAAKKLTDKNDSEIFEQVASELKKVCPEISKLNKEITPFDIERWDHAMPKFYHGYITIVREFLDQHQGENNIFFAGDYLNAPWTEGAARSGVRAAEAIIKKFSIEG